MVQVTDRATAELQRLLTTNFARPQQGVRLRLNQSGDLAMTIDVPHAGDSIIRRDNVAVLIVDGRLGQRLAQRVLDFPSAPEAASRFDGALRWPTRHRLTNLTSGDNRDPRRSRSIRVADGAPRPRRGRRYAGRPSTGGDGSQLRSGDGKRSYQPCRVNNADLARYVQAFSAARAQHALA